MSRTELHFYDADPPLHLRCPISYDIFTTPVHAPDGHTYEDAVIRMCLLSKEESPISRSPMTAAELTPNYAMLAAVDAWKKEHRIANLLPSVQPAQLAVAPTTVRVKTEDVHMVSTSGARINGRQFVEVRVTAPREPDAPVSRSAFVLVCVIDTSGSMDAAASNRVGECDYSRLDLVLQSMRAIIAMAGDDDKIALITFSTNADIRFPLSRMTHANKMVLLEKLLAVEADGQTNIFQALSLAVRLCAATAKEHAHILLLTDGEESVTPACGSTQAWFVGTMAAEGAPPVSLHTMGFGYDVPTPGMSALARAGRGWHGFIPDASMLGTIFVNFMSYLTSIAVNRLRVSVTMAVGEARMLNMIGPDPDTPQTTLYQYMAELDRHTRGVASTASGKPIVIDAGALLAGETRSWVLEVISDADEWWRDVQVTTTPRAVSIDTGTLARVDVSHRNTLARQEVVGRLGAAYEAAFARDFDTARACAHITACAETLVALTGRAVSTESAHIAALLSDLVDPLPDKGQLGKSVESHANFRNWGKGYILAAQRAHEMQIVMNFRDASMQFYKGPVFSAMQRVLEAIYTDLPVPNPSRKAGVAYIGSRGGGSSGASLGIGFGASSLIQSSSVVTQSPPQTMEMFYNSGGGCLHPDSLVTLKDGTRVWMRDVKKGMWLKTSTGPARVKCVVETRVSKDNGTTIMWLGSSTGITEYHPVKDAIPTSDWIFPVQITTGRHHIEYVESVFDCVMEDGKTDFLVGMYYCVSLGHGITTSPAAVHAYLGTRAVLDDLALFPGWEEGHVLVDGSRTERCPDTRGIIKFFPFVEDVGVSVSFPLS